MKEYTAFLLSYVRYGDHDAVIHCFTAEEGYRSFFLRGLYAAKNKKKALLYPLSEVSLVVNTKKNSALPAVSGIEARKRVVSGTEDIKVNSIVFFIAEVLDNVLRNEGQNGGIFNEIERFATQLAARNYSAHFHLLFTIMPLLGIKPLLSGKRFLDPESGVFVDEIAHRDFGFQTSVLWKEMLTETDYTRRFSAEEKQQLLQTLMIYYTLHLPEFRQPVSLDVLRELFQ
ncbi:MAG: hypothetical protein EAS48_00645 [Chryseobacterium sp.]|nr:MAG: hypothetical protein EAS48_00645 [Chryseobacterium sp.]